MNHLQAFKTLPKPHMIMLGICGTALLLFAVAHYVAIRPIARNVDQYEREVEQTESALREDGWPLDVGQLEALAARKDQELRRATQAKDRVIAKSTELFRDKVMYLYENWAHFEEQASYLDYQQEFLRIEGKLSGKGLVLHSDVLGLSEDSTGEEHELILQVWLLEAAIDKILAYNLKPVMAPAVPPSKFAAATADLDKLPKASSVTILPPTPYYLHKTHQNPYLLEFGLRLRLRGKASDLHDFLEHASEPPSFLAIPRMEIEKPLPSSPKYTDDTVEAEIICTAFYLLDDTIRPTRNENTPPPVLPPGA